MYKVSDITFKKQDEYERKNIAKNIYHSISLGEFYSPCLLDGQWGSGKTEFCHKLHNYIIEQNSAGVSNENFTLVPIYINVFNAERINNPFLSLMGGLVGSTCNGIAVPTSLIETASTVLSTEAALKPIGIGAVKDIYNIFISKIKEYAPETTDAVIKQITDGFNNEFSNGLFENAFEEVNKLDKKYQDFSTELANFATEKTPIVFIIDELDRCRPNFAIQFLECIKHFFNVDNVYFLLSCNVDQLIASIAHLYGEKIDGENYLEKFFEDKITLQNKSTDHKANIQILNSINTLSCLSSYSSQLTEFIFSTTTLRRQHKIANKFKSIQLEINKPDFMGMTNRFNCYSDHPFTDIIILTLAYLATGTESKITNTQTLLTNSIFLKMLDIYCHNVKIASYSLKLVSDIKKETIEEIKINEKLLNQLIKKITYS